ncbi:MAG TPA: hypothetical protein P5287_06885 [bacterium]|nr:hypothetical protein [bacterium]
MHEFIRVRKEILGAALVEWIKKLGWVEEFDHHGRTELHLTYKGLVEMNDKGVDLERVIERSQEGQ